MNYSTVSVLLVVSQVLVVGCEDGSCEEARKAIQTDIATVCRDDPSYQSSKFCNACVLTENLFSVTDECECRPLTLTADFCYFESGEEAYNEIRNAIDYADAICEQRDAEPKGAEGGGGSSTSSVTTAATTSGPGGGDAGAGGNASSSE